MSLYQEEVQFSQLLSVINQLHPEMCASCPDLLTDVILSGYHYKPQPAHFIELEIINNLIAGYVAYRKRYALNMIGKTTSYRMIEALRSQINDIECWPTIWKAHQITVERMIMQIRG